MMSTVIQLRARLLALLVMVLTASLLAADDESLQELLAKAQVADDRQAERYAKIAQRQVEVANDYFSKGELAQGHAAVKDVVTSAGKALASAKQAKKRLKQTEITLRKTSRRLADVARTLAFEDRPAVNQAVEDVEAIRTQVLELIFGPTRKTGENVGSIASPKPERQQ